jgi:Tfp pilus assembly protein PilE
MIHQRGISLTEVVGALAGLTLFSTLVVIAISGVRQRQQVEAASARLEEAQNLLARWRAGESVSAPGWTFAVQPAAAGSEMLVLRGVGVRLSTVRVHQGAVP